jgi:hypothetical protein
MARDSQKNSAYDSGIRGSERPKAVKTSGANDKTAEDNLPNGATRMEILPADNGFIINCSWPPPKDKKDYMVWSPPKPKVFTSAEDVAEFIGAALKVKEKD